MLSLFPRDPLTQAYSRESLAEQFQGIKEHAQQTAQPFCLILFDLDYFKSINDAFGHAAGDEVLRTVAAQVSQLCRAGDRLFRYGGDEFLLFLLDTNAEQAANFIQRLAQHFSETYLPTTPPIQITLSGGIAIYPQDGEELETLCAIADRRHYTAKQNGRNRIAWSENFDRRGIQKPARLIGRDEALRTVQNFLERLESSTVRALRVHGEAADDLDDFFQHIARLAMLQGYLPIYLRGNIALKQRAFGAFLESNVPQLEHQFSEWSFPESPSTWQEMLKRGARKGWLFLVEDWTTLDSYSQELIRRLHHDSGTFTSGLIYQAQAWEASAGFPFDLQPVFSVRLLPLSKHQVQAWIRQSLGWDPPEDFLAWLITQTQGRTARLYRLLEQLLEKGELYQERGEWQLKPEVIWRENLLQERESGYLSLPSGLFFGRHVEITTLKHHIRQHRLVTIVAPGGMGKTRLALQVAAELQHAFPDGVYALALEGTTDAATLPLLVAEALSLRLPRRLSAQAALEEALREQQVLLILDNFEQLVGTESFLHSLLAHTHAPHVLITSRLPVGHPDETIFRLEGLPVPAAGSEKSAEFETLPSIRLFLEQTHQQGDTLSLTPETRRILASLVRAIGGMPLGLKVAASLSTLIGLENVERRLRKSGPVLVASPSLPLDRLYNTFWKVLSPTERRILTQLAVFPSHFTTAEAGEISGASPFFLNALTHFSLLTRREDGRFEFHPLLRQYLAERLGQNAMRQRKLQERFLGYFAHFAADMLPYWQFTLSEEQRREVKTEMENLRLAWELALQQRNHAAALPLLFALHDYQQHYGWIQEGYQLFQKALEQIGSGSEAATRRLRAFLQLSMARYDFHRGHYRSGVVLAQQARHLLYTLSQQGEEYPALVVLVDIAYALGHTHKARLLLKRIEAIGIARQDSEILSSVYSYRAILAYQEKNWEEAEQFFLKALEIHQRENKPIRIVVIWNNLGNLAYERRDYPQARSYLEKALTLAEALEGQTLLAAVLDSLGKTLIALRDYTLAFQYLRRGLEICRRVNAYPLAMELLINLGHLYKALGNSPQARRIWDYVVRDERTVQYLRQRAQQLLIADPLRETPFETFEALWQSLPLADPYRETSET